MPSPEAKMLADFLVAPAALRDFMTLPQFTAIFPKGHRANPAIQDLYRELQRLREQDVDNVRRSIAHEVKRSKQLRREYAYERRQRDGAMAVGLDAIGLQMEAEMSGQGQKRAHTLQTILASIDESCQGLEAQIAEIEKENRTALAQVKELVGALSDLRHGRFAQSATGQDTGEEALVSLKRLEAVCANPLG